MDKIIQHKTHQVMLITSGTESQNLVIMKRIKPHYTQAKILGVMEGRPIETTSIVGVWGKPLDRVRDYPASHACFGTKEKG